MSTDTPIARVDAYARIARQRPAYADLIDSAYEPADGHPRRHDLHVADLLAVLDALADACDDHMRCEACGAHMCETCGIGEIADCPADHVHCTSPWCFDQACMDQAAVDHATEIAEDIALERCES